MSSNSFGSNSFGTPVAEEPPVPVDEGGGRGNKRLAILGGAAGAAVLVAAGVWFGLPVLTSDDTGTDTVATPAPAPAASTPDPEADVDAQTEALPTIATAGGRNPFLPGVLAAGAAADTGGQSEVTGDATDASAATGSSEGDSADRSVLTDLPTVIEGAPGDTGPEGPQGLQGPQGVAGQNGATPLYLTVTWTGYTDDTTDDPKTATFNVITAEGPATLTVAPKNDVTSASGVLAPEGSTAASLMRYMGTGVDPLTQLEYVQLQFGDSQIYKAFQDGPFSLFFPLAS